MLNQQRQSTEGKLVKLVTIHKLKNTEGLNPHTKHNNSAIHKYHIITLPTTTTVLRPFFRESRVSWCQKRTSGLYGARED